MEWSFLEQTILKLGFSQNWVSLIVRCISFISFFVIINGMVSGVIQPQRGLRQGCSLSPYLFIICVEVFLLYCCRLSNRSSFIDCPSEIVQESLIFSSLMTVLFLPEHQQLTVKTWKEFLIAILRPLDNFLIMKNLPCFLVAMFRMDKPQLSKIFFDSTLCQGIKCLGLPSMVRRKRSSFFNDIKLKVLSKITNWQHKFFSCRGKEVLIKVVAQAIPAYAMSVF